MPYYAVVLLALVVGLGGCVLDGDLVAARTANVCDDDDHATVDGGTASDPTGGSTGGVPEGAPTGSTDDAVGGGGTDIPASSGDGIWISAEEIMALPTSGKAWDALLRAANESAGTPDLSDQDQSTNVRVMARALVYARTGQERYRTEVRASCMAAIDTELGGRTLALGRELMAYVIAADLVGLEPSEDRDFRAWLRRTLTENLDGRTLVSTHEDRPNNWGTHAGASRIAVAVYLGDTAELERAAAVFRGWAGERSVYADFDFGDLSWQANRSAPVGVNARGTSISGFSVDGAQPEEMRRGCSFRVPPCSTGYAWEGLQGAIAEAELLHRQGYPAYEWGDRAILRAVQFLDRIDREFGGWWAEGDDTWLPWIVNARYGTSFRTVTPSRAGKNAGYGDWTHPAR
jgi:hypothetical protein